MTPGQLSTEEYALVRRLNVVGPQRVSHEPAAASLIEKGLAALSEDGAKITITEEGKKIGRVVSAA